MTVSVEPGRPDGCARTRTGSLPAPRSEPHREVWFGDPQRPLHGWLCVPADGRARQAVVICPPVGEEGRATHRTMRRLAEELAARGVLALRFDYDGTGDSAGHPQDPDRVPAWLGSISAGLDLVTGTGVERVSLVGMRLGATLAATLAADPAREHALAALVLWDPCASGRMWLREGEALHAFGEGAEAGGIPDDGLRHTPGFQYDAATASALRGVDLSRLAPEGPLAGRVLLLERPDRGPAVDPARFATVAGRYDRLDALGQERLLDVRPTETEVPEATVTAIADWLTPARSPGQRLALPPAATAGALVPSGGVGSAVVREYGVGLGAARLFGVVTEPVDGVPDGAPWVVLVNVAVEHHVGPGRQWVELARLWAARGYRAVRLDQTGIGDSPGLPGRDDVLFAPQWITDLPDVVDVLAGPGTTKAPVIMVSLCAGVASALEAAQHTRVDSVFGANPRLTLFEAGYDTPGYHRRRHAATTPARPVVWLARRRRILAGGIWRIYRQVALWHAPVLFLDRTVRRGTVVSIVACPEDAQHFTEVLAWRPRLRRRMRQGTLRLESTDRIDHSLLGRGAQAQFAARATTFVAERHAELAQRPATSNPTRRP